MRWVALVLLAAVIAAGGATAYTRAARQLASDTAMLEGKRLLDAGRLDEAKVVLKDAYLADRGNRPLRELLREVNLAIGDRDAAKAHLQHGHEGPGGTLRPEDVER
jgi:hypothetical protein